MERGGSDLEAPTTCTSAYFNSSFRTRHAPLHLLGLLQLTLNDRYVFRTFIRKSLLYPAFLVWSSTDSLLNLLLHPVPNQGLRKKSVRRKLSPIECEFEGRNVLVVDDSLVRGFVELRIFIVEVLIVNHVLLAPLLEKLYATLFHSTWGPT
jgi:hypothetical protein